MKIACNESLAACRVHQAVSIIEFKWQFASQAVALLSLLALTVPAFAHAHLTASTPAANANVPSGPNELDLTFSEGVNLKFTGVKVTGPHNETVSTGAASLRAGGSTTLVVPISARLAAGTYKVDWHVLARDGHKTNGVYTFTVSP